MCAAALNSDTDTYTWAFNGTGAISSGTLAGDDVTQTITFVNLDLTACSTTGLDEISGTSTWSFTGL